MVANSSKISLGVCQRKLLFVSLFVAVLLVSCTMVVGAESSVVGAVHVGSEAELRAAIKNATPGVPVVIALDSNILLKDDAIFIDANKDITLSSNNKNKFYQLIGTIKDRHVNTISVSSGGVLRLDGIIVTHTKGTSGEGVYVTSSGTLIMIEGEISNNKLGGVYNQGHFIMYGGKISNNRNAYTHISSVTFVGGYGGGVNNEGKFEMFGGEISNNTADKNGGGIHNTGTFIMYGGKISGNTADTMGGGIHNVGTFKKRGGEIINNTAPEGNNVYPLKSNSWLSITTICVSAVVVVGIVIGVLFLQIKKRRSVRVNKKHKTPTT